MHVSERGSSYYCIEGSEPWGGFLYQVSPLFDGPLRKSLLSAARLRLWVSVVGGTAARSGLQRERWRVSHVSCPDSKVFCSCFLLRFLERKPYKPYICLLQCGLCGLMPENSGELEAKFSTTVPGFVFAPSQNLVKPVYFSKGPDNSKSRKVLGLSRHVEPVQTGGLTCFFFTCVRFQVRALILRRYIVAI